MRNRDTKVTEITWRTRFGTFTGYLVRYNADGKTIVVDFEGRAGTDTVEIEKVKMIDKVI